MSEIAAQFEALLAQPHPGKYVLRLYVAGLTERSSRAITNIKTPCEAHLAARYLLTVINLSQDESRAKDDHILAAPTLIKRLPLPLRRLIDDLSDEKRVLLALDLEPDPTDGPSE